MHRGPALPAGNKAREGPGRRTGNRARNEPPGAQIAGFAPAPPPTSPARGPARLACLSRRRLLSLGLQPRAGPGSWPKLPSESAAAQAGSGPDVLLSWPARLAQMPQQRLRSSASWVGEPPGPRSR